MVGIKGHAAWVVVLALVGFWFGLTPHSTELPGGQALTCVAPWFEQSERLCTSVSMPYQAAAWMFLSLAVVTLAGLAGRLIVRPGPAPATMLRVM